MRIYFRKGEKIIKAKIRWAINNKNIKHVRYSKKYIK